MNMLTRFSSVPAKYWFRSISFALILGLLIAWPSASIVAQEEDDIPERPPTEELLPETTVAFVQVDNFQDMIEKFRNSGAGKLYEDESIAALTQGMWSEVENAYNDVKDDVGLELEDITSLPQGEMTFAVIAPRRKNPEFFMLLELNNEDQALDRVLNRGREILEEEEGQEITTETSDDGFEFKKFRIDDRTVKFFQRDGLLVGCTSEDELNAFIDRWMGREVKKVRPLTANRKFVTIMNRCLGTDELKPEARFFVDPIQLAKSATRGNFAAQATINFLPLLGLDGLLGIGGSMLLDEKEFDSVVHGHVLLSNPRGGIFEMIALKPTDYEPEAWVPDDVVNYWTTSWDFDKMLSELTKMIETAQGEGVVDEFIENNINSELQIDLREDLIAQLDGRVTFTQWIQPPAKINSTITLIGIGFRDAEKARELVAKLVDRSNRDLDEDEDPRIVESEYRGVAIWSEPTSRTNRRQERMREFRDRRRQRRLEQGAEPQEDRVELDLQTQTPALAIVGNTLLVTPQSRQFLERAIDTQLGNIPSLRDDDEYLAIEKQMRKLLKNESPCALFFQNPEPQMQLMMDLVNSDNTQKFITQAAEGNKYLTGFKQQLDENPLPDFDKVKQYFTKTGGFATTDDTGYHFLFFNLRPKDEQE